MTLAPELGSIEALPHATDISARMRIGDSTTFAVSVASLRATAKSGKQARAEASLRA